METNLKNSKILVADDSLTLRKRIVEFMKLEGFETLEASSGEEVLEVVESFHPDLILLDVVMPGKSGIEVCRSLRALSSFSQVPILMLTVKTSAFDVSEAFKAGATDYIRKPFGAEELLLRIRVHLQTRHLLRKLEQVNRVKNDLIGMAAHDIRPPLTNILGLTQYLRNILDKDNEEVNFALSNMEWEGDRILSLVDTMLDVTVIQSGKFTLVKEWIDCSRFLQDVVKQFSSLGNSRKIKVECALESESSFCEIDPYRIQQVLANLIGNACSHAPEGSKVTIRLLETDSEVCLRVEDEGPGILQENLDKIFDPFFRENFTDEKVKEHIGLSLAISRKIAAEHGATMFATNLESGGAAFTICFPKGQS